LQEIVVVVVPRPFCDLEMRGAYLSSSERRCRFLELRLPAPGPKQFIIRPDDTGVEVSVF
jgi:hypothetical protein